MKLAHILQEMGSTPEFTQWQRACRAAFPNCTFIGNSFQSQAVDWTSPSSEVAGDWERDRGVVYKPGSRGKEVLDTFGGQTP